LEKDLFIKYSNSPKDLTKRQEYFISRLKEIHPDLELVSEYINFTSKILVKNKYGICESTANKLLNGVVPCIRSAINKNEYFINQAKEIHGSKYDYSSLIYPEKYGEKLEIICPIHGKFNQLPNHHLAGQGCKKCNNANLIGGWYSNSDNYNKLCTMYILRFNGNNEVFLKFGITIDLTKRLDKLRTDSKNVYDIQVVKQINNTAKYCYELEQRFKKTIWKKRRTYIPKTEFGGMWECFKI